MISVVIPVGPYPSNKRWLVEAIQSVQAQTLQPVDVILVDDGAELAKEDWLKLDEDSPHNNGLVEAELLLEGRWLDLSVYKCPWRTGISAAFNYGVMLAWAECVFMLGSDDTLEPTCLEQCYASYLKHDKKDGYYSVPIKYMDTGEVQTAPCNAAMITKGFMRLSGGFPIETGIGIGDSTLLSICLAHKLPVYWVGEDVGQPETPLYNYRRHPDIHTYKINWGIADQIRSYLTETWNAEEVKQWVQNY